jgi:hypothetical protein
METAPPPAGLNSGYFIISHTKGRIYVMLDMRFFGKSGFGRGFPDFSRFFKINF